MYRGGLKKCVPKNRSRCDFSPAAIFAIGSPEVFVLNTACGARCGITRSSSARLISRFSATTSMTQSHCFSFGKSSSKFPTDTMDVSDGS